MLLKLFGIIFSLILLSLLQIQKNIIMKRKEFIKKTAILTAGTVAGSALFPGSSELQAKIVPSKPDISEWKDDEINITWIGHATVLINFYGTWIITDPVMFSHVGIYIWGLILGPSRYTKPALEFDELPKIDLVLLSHAHMDHMDIKTLANLTSKYPGQIDCITAANTKDVIEDLNWKSLHEMDWNDNYLLHNINFTAIEVKHFGWRFPWEKDRSRGYMKDGRSFNAYYMYKNGKGILFGGDTAFSDKFNTLKGKKIDIAIMPIGAYNPWRRSHCNPEEALIMADQIDAKYFIPIHCHTFRQGQEPIEEPLNWMNDVAENFNTKPVIKMIGESFKV